MTNTHESKCTLHLQIPIHGEGPQAKDDPWLAGRTTFEATQHVFRTLSGVGGLREGGQAERTGRHLTLLEVSYGFRYENLAAAVDRFVETRQELNFPKGTQLTHWKIFLDGSMESHLMLRWLGEELDPIFTDLSDRNLHIPQTA